MNLSEPFMVSAALSIAAAMAAAVDGGFAAGSSRRSWSR
jgi:hypothetical protein